MWLMEPNSLCGLHYMVELKPLIIFTIKSTTMFYVTCLKKILSISLKFVTKLKGDLEKGGGINRVSHWIGRWFSTGEWLGHNYSHHDSKFITIVITRIVWHIWKAMCSFLFRGNCLNSQWIALMVVNHVKEYITFVRNQIGKYLLTFMNTIFPNYFLFLYVSEIPEIAREG